MIEALLNYQFLQNAMIAGVLASVVCGMIGVIVIEKSWL
jgi:zinc transport system permease protein